MKTENLFETESNPEILKCQLVTRADLLQFQSQLIENIQSMLSEKTNTSKQWLRSVEVKKLLGVSSGTLQNLRLNGTLPFSKMGGIIYYNLQDIQRILKDNTQ